MDKNPTIDSTQFEEMKRIWEGKAESSPASSEKRPVELITLPYTDNTSNKVESTPSSQSTEMEEMWRIWNGESKQQPESSPAYAVAVETDYGIQEIPTSSFLGDKQKIANVVADSERKQAQREHFAKMANDEEYRDNYLRTLGYKDSDDYRQKTADRLESVLDVIKSNIPDSRLEATPKDYAMFEYGRPYRTGDETAAVRQTRKVREAINTLRSNNFWRGLAEGFDINDLTTLGFAQVGENVAALSALEKARKGEKLTPAEKSLVDAWKLGQQVEGEISMLGGRGVGANIGSGFGQAIPFVAEMAATGGVAAAATKGISKTLAKKGIQEAAEAYIKAGSQKATKKASEQIIKGLEKAGLNFAESAIGNAVRVPLTGGVYNNYTGKRLEQFALEDGKIQKYATPAWKDALKAGFESWTEYFTEDIGKWMDAPLNKVGSGLAHSRFGKFLRLDRLADYKGNPYVMKLRDIAKINNLPAEMGEEVLNDVILNTFYNDKEGWREMASLDYWWQLAGVTALMQGAFGAANMLTPGMREYNQRVSELERIKKESLNAIKDPALKAKVAKAGAASSIAERSGILSSIDWKGKKFTKQDAFNAVKYINAQTEFDIAEGESAETERLSRFFDMAQLLGDGAYRGVDGKEDTGDMVSITDNKGYHYTVISGDIDSNNPDTILKARDAKGKIWDVPMDSVTDIRRNSISEGIAQTYAMMFNVEVRQEQLDALQSRISEAAAAGVSTEDIKEILRNKGLEVFENGDVVRLNDGRLARVENLNGDHYIVTTTDESGTPNVERIGINDIQQKPALGNVAPKETTTEQPAEVVAEQPAEVAPQPTPVEQAVEAVVAEGERAIDQRIDASVNVADGNVYNCLIKEDDFDKDGNEILSAVAIINGQIEFTENGEYDKVKNMNKTVVVRYPDGRQREIGTNRIVEVEVTSLSQAKDNAHAELREVVAQAVEPAMQEEVAPEATPVPETEAPESIESVETPTPEAPAPVEVDTVAAPEVSEVPRTKDGNVDYESIVDPVMYATSLEEELGTPDAALEAVETSIEGYTAEVVELREKAKKEKKISERVAMSKKADAIDTYLGRLNEVKNILSKEVRVINGLAEALGLSVEYVDEVDGGRANAQIVGDKVQIARYNRDLDKTIKFLIGHEFTHRLQDLSPEAYAQFKAAVIEHLDWRFENAVKQLRDIYNRQGRYPSTEILEDEVVADFAGNLATTTEVFDEFVEAQPVSKWQQMWEKVLEVLQNIASYFTAEDIHQATLNNTIVKLSALLESASAKVSEENAEEVPDTEGRASIKENSAYIRSADDLRTEGFDVDDTGSVRYSVRTTTTEEQREKIVADLMVVTDSSRKKVEKWLESESSLAAAITNNPDLDYIADDYFVAIKSNSDYPQGTVDFNNICRKRLDFTNIYSALQKEFPNRVFTANDLEVIRQTMIEDGLMVACGLCYVEDRRQLMGEIAEEFIARLTDGTLNDKVKGIVAEDYIPTIADLLTPEGATRLREEHPSIFEAFRTFNNARGMQSARLLENYAEYKREILDWSEDKVRKANNNGGLRVFSFSDFEAHHLIDIVQVIIDAAAKGVMIQGYTKVPAFARAVRSTGIKLNRSLIANGSGVKEVDGKKVLDYDPVEGIDVNDPNFLNEESNPNVGNIIVGMSDEQIQLAMKDPFIDYIIPFHSGLRKEILVAKKIGHWTNYKLSQREKDIETGKAAKNGINIYTDVLQAAEAEGSPIQNKRQFVNKFLQVAKERGLEPRFSQFLKKNKKGEYIYTEGYHKFLVDFKLFDKSGKIVPQQPVQPIFDDAFNAQILEAYLEETKQSKEYGDTIDKIKERLGLNEQTEEVTYSDARYSIKETNPEILEQLNNGETIKVYRAMQVIDGKLYPPMSAKVDGKLREPIELGVWERAEERPDLADEKGYFKLDKGNKSSLKARYNPYIHTSLTPLNDQFSSAQDRPNLVTVEVEVPKSELTSGYKAEKAKDSVGQLEWKAGVVQGQLSGTRTVVLSRWDRPSRIVPDSEVAQRIVEMFGDTQVTMPSNVVTPSLRAELEKLGVPFKETDNQGQAKKTTTLSERSDADSHNSSSKGLPKGSSERLSAGPLTFPKDVAKISKRTEITKRAAINIINEGGLKRDIKTPAQAVSALGKGLHLDKSRSSQSYYGDFFEGDYFVNGKVVHLRISTHPATGDRMGNTNADHKVSIVIRGSGEHRSRLPYNRYEEILYEPELVSPRDAANAVVKGVKSLIETGEYIDTTGKAVRKHYPSIDEQGQVLYSIKSSDAAYLDAVKRGDMETAQRMVNEAAEMAGYTTDESWKKNHRAPRKDEENANPFNTEIIVPADYWAHPEWYTQIRHNATDRESYYNLKPAIDKYKRLVAEGKQEEADKVTVIMYRGVDKRANKREASFRNGDWITPSRQYALMSAPYGNARVIEQEVPLKNIWWDGNSINEWGYDDGSEYTYKDTKNNRKLLDAVTYDDNGNVIPLSERFNPRKEDVRFSVKSAPVFYSNAENAVRNIKQEKATPEQWLKMIEKNGGLKVGEDKWLGLSDWLKASEKKTLTKDEVMEYINQNQIQIEEVKYREFGPGLIDEAANILTRELQVVGIDGLREKYPDFDDYFEVDGNEVLWSENTASEGEYEDYIIEHQITNVNPIDNAINERRLSYTTRGLRNKQEIALVVPTIESWNASDEIHFGDAGEGRAVAWMRFGETTDTVGNRVLVIDEIQSKRHQEGRDRGYISKEEKSKIEAIRKQKDELSKMRRDWDYRTGQAWRQFQSGEITEQEYNRLWDTQFDIERIHLDEIGRSINTEVDVYDTFTKIPSAPFEKNWAELAMKRMLRYAAENGYDKVAWTTGEQQAERYNLGAVMTGLKAYKTYSGEYYVMPYNNGAIGEFTKEYTEKELADTFGKELATNIITNAENATEENPYEIEDENLRFGGSGMKTFYDTMLVNFMNKYGKKWGVKVGEVTMPELKENNTMHSVDVTDAMRDSVMQGQLMFSIKSTPAAAVMDQQRAEFEKLTEEYGPLLQNRDNNPNFESALNEWRDRKVKVLQDYLYAFAEDLGIDQYVVIDIFNTRGVREEYSPIVDLWMPGISEEERQKALDFLSNPETVGVFAPQNGVLIDVSHSDDSELKVYEEALVHEFSHYDDYHMKSDEDLFNLYVENEELIKKFEDLSPYVESGASEEVLATELLSAAMGRIYRRGAFTALVNGSITSEEAVGALKYSKPLMREFLIEKLNRYKDYAEQAAERRKTTEASDVYSNQSGWNDERGVYISDGTGRRSTVEDEEFVEVDIQDLIDRGEEFEIIAPRFSVKNVGPSVSTLPTAEQMERELKDAGVAPEEIVKRIKEETGWFRNNKGHWSYKLPKSQSWRDNVAPIEDIEYEAKPKSALQSAREQVTRLYNELRNTRANIGDIASKISKEMRGAISTELVEVMGKRDLDNLIRIIEEAVNKGDLEPALRQLGEQLVSLERAALLKSYNKTMNLKLEGTNPRGVSVSRWVDETARVAINTFKDCLAKGKSAAVLEAEFNEEWQFGKNKKSRDPWAMWTAMDLLQRHASWMALEEDIEQIDAEVKELRIDNSALFHKGREASANGDKAEAIACYRQIKINKQEIANLLAERLQKAEARNNSLAYMDRTLDETITMGRSVFAEQKAQREMRKAEIVKMAFEDCTNPKKPTPLIDEELSDGRKFGLAVHYFLTAPAYSMNTMLKFISINAPQGEGRLYDHFVRGERGYMAAMANFNAGYNAAMKVYADKAKEIFGKDYEKVISESDKDSNITVKIINGKRIEEMVLPYGTAMYVYMVDKMVDGRVKLSKMGISEEVVAEMVKALPNEYIQMADWIQEEFLPSLREKYNKTHLECFGIPMAQVDNYVPLKILQSKIYKEVDGSGMEMTTLPTAIVGAIVKRTRNTLPIDLHVNAFEVIREHVENMEHWNAYTFVIQDMNALLSSTEFRRMIEHQHPGLFKRLKEAAQIAAGTYRDEPTAVDKGFGALNKLAASSKIAFRVNTAIKQILSYPAFASYAMSGDFFANLLKNLSPTEWKKNFDWAIENVPGFKARWESRTAGNEKLAQATMSGFDKTLKKFNNIGMWPNAFVDALTCANGAKAVYDYRVDFYKERGFEEAEAQRLAKIDAAEALNATQQSSEGLFISSLQAKRDLFSVAVSTFQNSNFAYLRKQLEAVQEFRRDFATEVDNLAKRYMDNGMSEQEAKELAVKDVRKAKAKAAADLAVFTFGLNILWWFGNNVWKYAFGDDDDREEVDDEIWKSLAVSSVRNMTIGSMIESIAGGYGASPALFFSDLAQTINEIQYIAENDPKSWNKSAAFITARLISVNGLGVDLTTFANIYQGIAGMIRDGYDVEDLMNVLNAPQSQAKLIAGKPKDGETLDEYMARMAFLHKRFHPGAPDKLDLSRWERNYIAGQQRKLLLEDGHSWSEYDELSKEANVIRKDMGITRSGKLNEDARFEFKHSDPTQREFTKEVMKVTRKINILQKQLDKMVVFDDSYLQKMLQIQDLRKNLIEKYDKSNK